MCVCVCACVRERIQRKWNDYDCKLWVQWMFCSSTLPPQHWNIHCHSCKSDGSWYLSAESFSGTWTWLNRVVSIKVIIGSCRGVKSQSHFSNFVQFQRAISAPVIPIESTEDFVSTLSQSNVHLFRVLLLSLPQMCWSQECSLINVLFTNV